MKRRSFLAGALAGTALWPAHSLGQMAVGDAGRDLPVSRFVDGDGADHTLADFRGKVLLLNIWATWCVPCRREMPTLDRLQARLGGPDFHVLPLSIDRAGSDAVRRFYQEIQIENLGIYVGEEWQTLGALRVIGLPTTLLISREGQEIGRLVGPAEWDGPEAVAQFQSAIARS